jgi:hypothetical protein
MGLGYSYLSQPGNQSNRLGLRGPDASFTIGFSRLGLTADVGYAQASNVLGTGRHSAVLTYLAGPVFHHTLHRRFDSYVHVLVGGAKVSGPILTNGGTILLGGWTTSYAWAVGGGVEYWATDSMAIRTGADYLRTAFYDSSLAVRGQSNLGQRRPWSIISESRRGADGAKPSAASLHFLDERSQSPRPTPLLLTTSAAAKAQFPGGDLTLSFSWRKVMRDRRFFRTGPAG